jgi:hypothetical protein
MVAQWADLASAAARGERPVWIIPQAHDQSSYERKAPERGATPPTAAQQRCMTWLALIHGAKGLVWYTWDDGPDMGVKFHPSQQKELKELLSEVAPIAPVLLAEPVRRFTAGDGKVHGLVCSAPAGRLLVLANASSDAVSAVFDVEEASADQSFDAIPGGPGPKAQGKRLTVDLAPLAVQLYRF